MTTSTASTGTQTTDTGSQQATATDGTGTAPDATAQPQQGTDAPAASTLLTDTPAEGDKTDDAKTEGEATGEKPADKAEDDKSNDGPPEEYQEFAAPEGVTLDAELTGEFKELAKELGLSQENAQKVIDQAVKLEQKRATQQAETVAATVSKWATDTQADKELGGDKLTENMAVAKKALDTFGTPELGKLLRESGLGNHPEIIRAFYRAGKAIGEDGIVTGQKSPDQKQDARTNYPNSSMNP